MCVKLALLCWLCWGLGAGVRIIIGGFPVFEYILDALGPLLCFFTCV